MIRHERSQNRGFTIVELLIVVVIIAILAAITIVAYSGVRARTFESIAVNDLNTLGKQLELFKVDNGRYPLVAAHSTTPNLPEMGEVLKRAGLYSATRANIDPADPAQKPRDEKSFVFCSNPDSSQITIVAVRPVVDNFVNTQLTESIGKKLYYYRTGGQTGQTTFRYDTGIENSGVNICESVSPGYNPNTWPNRWSFDIPTLKAS